VSAGFDIPVRNLKALDFASCYLVQNPFEYGSKHVGNLASIVDDNAAVWFEIKWDLWQIFGATMTS
jgi:hypothetical protein